MPPAPNEQYKVSWAGRKQRPEWRGPAAPRLLILAARVVLEGGLLPPAACMTAPHDYNLLSVEIEGILNVFIFPVECLCMCLLRRPASEGAGHELMVLMARWREGSVLFCTRTVVLP